MAPVLSVEENKILEETIKKVYETLKRTESRTLETKRRANQTLENSLKHFSKAKQISNNPNADRLTESLNHANYRNKQEKQTVFSPQYSSLDNRGTPNRARPRQTCPISSKNEGAKKISTAAGGNNKLRTVIFKTLDRIFQLPNRSSSLAQPPRSKSLKSSSSNERQPPPPTYDGPLSLQELQRLNQSTADTLPRESGTFPFNEQDGLLNETVSANVVDCSYDESFSADESCWEFIDAPLKFVDATVDDTFTRAAPSICESKPENVSNSKQIVLEKGPRTRYQRKVKKSSENSRIQKRALERHAGKAKNEMSKVEDMVSIDIPASPTGKSTIILLRPDSPVEKQRNMKYTTFAVSLPNLMEAGHDLDWSSAGTMSDCGSDTFKRNISYCPSSTLSKSVPSFAENHENDDDACSISSSFSSFQRDQVYSNTNNPTHKSTLPIPSALRNDVLVHPITVPIEPFGHSKGEATKVGIETQAFQELTEIFTSGGKAEAVAVNIYPGLPIIQSAAANLSSTLINESLSAKVEDGCIITEEQKNSDKSGKSTTSNTSIPPLPPPFPPPPPPPFAAGSNTIAVFPLTVFTRRQEGNCIFNEMQDIPIDETDAIKLKEKFPMKPIKGLKRRPGKDKTKEFSSAEKKFLMDIELFLRTYRINNYDPLLRCILALDTKGPNVEIEWFTTLTQFIPKVNEIEIMRKSSFQKFENKSTAGKFITELLKIKNLHGKLMCIQFSLDFHEGFHKLSKWIDAFIAACDTIKMSDKFVSIINVIMRLLQSLQDTQSEIYGFDIQELTRLATRTSEDGSSTFLQFVIEYMLDKPELVASVDFYKAFTDLPDLTKTTIKDMDKQCKDWENVLKLYEAQINNIRAEKQTSCSELKCAIVFQSETAKTLERLNKKVIEAQHSFDSCKERFGLLNSETTEVIFFESLSKFVTTYQKTYKDIVERRERIRRQNKFSLNKRTSMGVISTNENISNGPNLIKTSRRKSISGAEFHDIFRSRGNDSHDNKLNKVNPRRKSCTPREIEAMMNAPTTDEIDKCFLNFLTKNDNGKENKPRKRVSPSSKIPVPRN